MEIVNCWECGEEVPRGDGKCPGCGVKNPGWNPTKREKDSWKGIRRRFRSDSSNWKVGLVIALIISFGVFQWLFPMMAKFVTEAGFQNSPDVVPLSTRGQEPAPVWTHQRPATAA